MITLKIFVLTFITLMVTNADGKSTLSPELIAKAQDVRERALDWLTSQRNDDFGWGDETAKVIVAIASSNSDWPLKSDLEARLSAKQLEIELLATLLSKHGIETVTPTRIAFYFLALSAICKDPYDFYGYNLVETLVKQQKDQDYSGFADTFGYGLSSLVSCLGETHLRKRQTRHLFQLLHKYESIETRSVASLTLECIHQSRNSETLKRHLHEGLETLGGMQRSDGSFGDTLATALATQSLGSIEESRNFWNKTSGLVALISNQTPTGSFNEDIYTTVQAIIGVSAMIDGRGLLYFRRHRCEEHKTGPVTELFKTSTTKTDVMTATSGSIITKINNKYMKSYNATEYAWTSPTTTSPPLAETHITNGTILTTPFTTDELFSTFTSSGSSMSPATKITVKYWLWIGPQPSTAEKYNITVQVPFNSTFYKVMQKAAEHAPIFEFSSAIWPNGHYVHTISGHREQPSGYNYWLLYRLPNDPDPKNPPGPEFVAPAGVDELLVHEGEIYLFWFKKI